MQKSFLIKKIAVLGAGVMGAQIAAHCVNAGIETLLFDLESKEGHPNALINQAIAHLSQLKPSPLATAQTSALLQARNYENNLTDLKDCDLIIEAIAERLDWKEALYQRITPYLNAQTILVSNTSGLSINSLADALPEAYRRQFCGVHFFNPPRYMHLAELIGARTTEPALLDHLETWLTRYLGKGVVRANDTPNFIANRIGVFSLLATLHHAQTLKIKPDEVDALTGALLGRPKSATFRTMDVVGLDTMQHVVHTMQQQLIDDPWHAFFKLPEWINALIQQEYLGQKSGQGIYSKKGQTIEVYDTDLGHYRPVDSKVDDEIKNIMSIPDPIKRMAGLRSSQNKQARFLVACYRDLFHYCAYHLQNIATTVRDIDLAMRWGFGWQQGPFETWQLSGLAEMREKIEQDQKMHETLSDAQLPQWLMQISEFYKEEGAYAPQQNQFESRSTLPIYQRQFFPDRVLKEKSYPTTTVFENEGIQLWSLQEDIVVASFKSKSNTISQPVLDGLIEAIEIAEKRYQGLIIYQANAANFSSGADLKSVASLIQAKKMNALETMVSQFQQVCMRLKYSAIPTVAALRGRALGGGCELMMHCDAIVSAFESYPGLVEVGVGIIPAGGGCKEMALRAAAKAQESDLMRFIQPYFQQIAQAQVATSAPHATQLGYLQNQDGWVMHANEVLYAAIARIKAMQAANYQMPLKTRFKVAGLEGYARLQVGLVNWLEGRFISDHDYLIGDQLAQVICGGAVNQGEWVDEAWLLNLERQAFMTLAATPLTLERMTHLLETGKPLRN